MLLPLILSCVIASLACAFLLRFGAASASRYSLAMPQRFHAGDVPRMGGAAMLLACVGGWALLGLPPGVALAWWAVAVIAAGTGLAEDLTLRVPVRWRLLLTLLGGAVATLSLDLHIGPLGLRALESLWIAAPWLGTLLAVVAVGGLPHAFNLIDGYNGLAGSVALICCGAIALVALQLGDAQLAGIVLVAAGATAGFLAWNYPRGLIFAGDGGAYLWGAVIAVASVQLVQRHDAVSPWFPALLLIYPVWETVFSAYRKLARGQSPGLADALHLHQLVFRRIVRGVDHEDPAVRMRLRNNRTAPYFWALALLAAVPSTLFWRSTPVLMAFCALFIVSYVAAYLSIVRFKVPGWLRR
ncbi:glycosyltransferase family 4 protein [Ramlibacter sp. MAHUQ-53]|uniref:glycosyltransferase family 4 protein n=1 Tax=unclassified Ramlibacter TaxID=2617605 RepID=UPI00362998EC